MCSERYEYGTHGIRMISLGNQEGTYRQQLKNVFLELHKNTPKDM